jgi:hypothetical protein
VATGVFSPLDRFMSAVPDIGGVRKGRRIVLRNTPNNLIAILAIDQIFGRGFARQDRARNALRIGFVASEIVREHGL